MNTKITLTADRPRIGSSLFVNGQACTVEKYGPDGSVKVITERVRELPDGQPTNELWVRPFVAWGPVKGD